MLQKCTIVLFFLEKNLRFAPVETFQILFISFQYRKAMSQINGFLITYFRCACWLESSPRSKETVAANRFSSEFIRLVLMRFLRLRLGLHFAQ